MPTRAYVRPGLVYMERQRRAATVSYSSVANWLGQNRETASSCSSRGNGMHHVHREPTGLDGTAETRRGIPQNGGKGLLFDRLRSKRDPVHREGCGAPQNRGNRLLFDLLQLKRGSCSSGGVWRTAKWDSMGYCSSTIEGVLD